MQAHSVLGAEPVSFNEKKEVKKLPTTNLESKPEKKLPEKDFAKVPQKKSVFLLFILCIITLGIYPAVWYKKKSKEFYNLGTQKRLSKTLATILLTFSIITVATVIVFPLTITSEMGTFYQNLSSLQTMIAIILGLAILLEIIFYILIAFISRGIINEALDQKNIFKKISWFFTLIFNFLYLQYEINRITDDKEDNPKKAPWIIFIIILILIVFSITGSILGFI